MGKQVVVDMETYQLLNDLSGNLTILLKRRVTLGQVVASSASLMRTLLTDPVVRQVFSSEKEWELVAKKLSPEEKPTG